MWLAYLLTVAHKHFISARDHFQLMSCFRATHCAQTRSHCWWWVPCFGFLIKFPLAFKAKVGCIICIGQAKVIGHSLRSNFDATHCQPLHDQHCAAAIYAIGPLSPTILRATEVLNWIQTLVYMSVNASLTSNHNTIYRLVLTILTLPGDSRAPLISWMSVSLSKLM